MKKIFISIPWFVPAFRAGGPVQSVANLVREYHEGVEYFIFCQDVDLNGAALENVIIDQWVSYNDHTKVWYAGPEKISDTILREIKRQKPDILFMIGIFSWHFNLVPLLFCKIPGKILSVRGMLHPGALSQKKWKKKLYLRGFKMMNLHQKISFHASDEEEKKYIQQIFGPETNIFMAGNFTNKIGPLPLPAKEAGKLKLVSIALLSPMKNILMILEALERCMYEVQYAIYGAVKDEEYWEVCKEKMRELPANIKVTYHKEIPPPQVKEALLNAHVFILPSKSENFGHALYEALSAARPVITSPHTPWQRLMESHAGINVSVADTLDLENAIHFFSVMDAEELEKWSRGAFDYSEKAINAEEMRNSYGSMFGDRERIIPAAT